MATAVPDLVHGAEAQRFGGWSWREPSRGEHFRTCSYCGSIHPEDLADESGWAAEWADQKYGWPHKFYVRLPNRTSEQRFVIGATTSSERPAGDDWVPAADLRSDVNTEGWGDLPGTYAWVLVGTRPAHHGKFYTVHLADPAAAAVALERVQAVSGLRFRFAGGRVSWAAAR
jgi:hypothetical protein